MGGEADGTVWLPVADAVEQHEAGTLAMLPPTIQALRELSAYRLGGARHWRSPVRSRRCCRAWWADGERLRLLVDGG